MREEILLYTVPFVVGRIITDPAILKSVCKRMQRVLCFSLLSPTLLDATMLECQMIMIMALSNKNQFS